MKRKIKGYRVSINCTVCYDPTSEVPGISVFYPEGPGELVQAKHYWNDFYDGFGLVYTKESAIARMKELLEQWVFAGRYRSGTIDIQRIFCTLLYR